MASDIALLNDAARMGAEEEEVGGEALMATAGVAEEPPVGPQSHAAVRRAAAVQAVAARARVIAHSADDFNILRAALPLGAEDEDDLAAEGSGGGEGGAAAVARSLAGVTSSGNNGPRAAAQAAREAALATTRAIVSSGALRPESTRVRVAGVTLLHAEKVEALLRGLELNKRTTPNYFQEAARGLGAEPVGIVRREGGFPASPFLEANAARLGSARSIAPPTPPRRAPAAAAGDAPSALSFAALRASPQRAAPADPRPSPAELRPSPAAATKAGLLSRYAKLEGTIAQHAHSASKGNDAPSAEAAATELSKLSTSGVSKVALQNSM